MIIVCDLPSHRLNTLSQLRSTAGEHSIKPSPSLPLGKDMSQVMKALSFSYCQVEMQALHVVDTVQASSIENTQLLRY